MFWLVRLLLLAVVLFAVAMESAFSQTSAPPYQYIGTRRMAERLQKIAREGDPKKDMFLTRERAKVLAAELTETKDPGITFKLQPQLAAELLKSGDSAEALAAYQKLEEQMKQFGGSMDSRSRANFLMDVALCQLRLGEQANCLINHSSESCILPIGPSAIHRDQGGSRAAVASLTEALQELPGNLKARWLLNIANMTLGEYPDKVPSDQLIPAVGFRFRI